MHTESIKKELNQLILPTTNLSLGDFKTKYSIVAKSEQLNIQVDLPLPTKMIEEQLKQLISTCLIKQGINNFTITISSTIATHKVQQGVKTIAGVKNIIAIASGKGGVGKSTVTTNLALALSQMGAKVGVLDADLYGPSQPAMFGLKNLQPEQKDQHFIPITSKHGIQVMSIGFLIDEEQAIIWRGPMVSQALQQLLFQTVWEDIDYLFIDLPPGTGDIQLTLSQKIPVTASVIVTTPQDIALLDAKKAINMFEKVNIPILGILENMSVHICSNCGHSEAIFGHSGGKKLAENLNVSLLEQLPLNIHIRENMDKGTPEEIAIKEQKITQLYNSAALKIAQKIALMAKDYSQAFPKIVIE